MGTQSYKTAIPVFILPELIEFRSKFINHQ